MDQEGTRRKKKSDDNGDYQYPATTRCVYGYAILTEWIKKPDRRDHEYWKKMERNHRKIHESNRTKIKTPYRKEIGKIVETRYYEPNSLCYEEP